MKTSLKDWPKVYRKIESVGGLTDDERIRFARSIAATPDERWEMNVNCVRALGFSGSIRSRRELERRKRELMRLEAPSLWRLQLSNAELIHGEMFGADSEIINPCES